MTRILSIGENDVPTGHQPRKTEFDPYGALYARVSRSTRSGPLFNAFPYPTKISPEAIALFIASHTDPGATVLDGFSGSGSTGLAAILCAHPTDAMIRESARLGLNSRWGARRAVLYELGVMGAFIADVMCHPPHPDEFRTAAEDLLTTVLSQWDWLYKVQDVQGHAGDLRYVVWSDRMECPKCRKPANLWDACVKRRPAEISSIFRCPHCHLETSVDAVERLRKQVFDGLTGQTRTVRCREQAWVYGETNGSTWSRAVAPSDHDMLERVKATPLPASVPVVPIRWGDLYRAGYHEGMSHLHHFYTRRNLLAFSVLWEATSRYPRHLQKSLQFWLLSYNTAHSTVMTRVVAKKGQDDLVVTSAQPGVLYVSGLPVEKNIFAGVRRKINTMTQAFALTHGHNGLVQVHNASCLSMNLPDGAIDYVFTDPPFGGNIPYSEVNFINEAWLGRVTDPADEAIVSPHQGKTVDDYEHLLCQAFREVHRVLRPDGCATVVFHSASAQVWNALRNACKQAGFSVTDTSVLNKTQASFKQVKTDGAVKGDPLILLSKTPSETNTVETDVWVVTNYLVNQALRSDDPSEATPQRLYSRLVAHYLEAGQNIPIDASAFYRLLGDAKSMPDKRAEMQRLLWARMEAGTHEATLPPIRRKRLGQFFTGIPLAP